MADICIIGAGVIGSLIARELAKYKLDIVIVEKESDAARGASGANSGIVHAGFDTPNGSLKARLNVRGAALMQQIAAELGVNFKRNGSLVIGFDDGDRKTIQDLYERGQKNGVKELSILSQESLHKLEPNSSKEARFALYAPTGAIICPYGLNIAALGNAMDNGVRFLPEFTVCRIDRGADGFTIHAKDGAAVNCRWCINAAGVYADEIARMAGDDSFSIHPRKGEYLLLDKECGRLVTRTIFRTPTEKGKGILVSPTVDGNLLLGPTSEVTPDRDNRATTAEGIAKILGEALQDVEHIPPSRVITSFAGLRASGNTGDFLINMPLRGFVNVAGIESPGLSSAPAIAEMVCEMLFGNCLCAEENKEFHPYRRPIDWFARLSMEEKNLQIAKNPRYGKIVCRCEGVSEGEILDAMRNNPKATTLDAVKRRTRAGMGRCGGGFCTMRILELLSEEGEIPFEAVTKSGGASFLTYGRLK